MLLGSAISACAPGEHPFMMVQMCLGSEQEILDFRQEMQIIATEEGMEFIDRSEAVRRGLESIGELIPEAAPAGPIYEFAVWRQDGLGFGAGDMNVPSPQVAIGFSKGSDPQEAHRFAARVINRLRERWDVHLVPAGRGALPLTQC